MACAIHLQFKPFWTGFQTKKVKCFEKQEEKAFIDIFLGLASGIVIAGFGSGALFFSPMMNTLMNTFSKMPTYLGNKLETITQDGKMFAKIGENLQVN